MRYVFFSFSWNDVWRAMIVRKSGVTKGGAFAAKFADAAEVEKVKKKTKGEIKSWIDGQLLGTSVTCVLISSDACKSDWVAYEIEKSIDRGNGLLGIHIHNVKDQNGNKGTKGGNPLPKGYRTYDWEDDKGHDNLASWIETAAKNAGK